MGSIISYIPGDSPGGSYSLPGRLKDLQQHEAIGIEPTETDADTRDVTRWLFSLFQWRDRGWRNMGSPMAVGFDFALATKPHGVESLEACFDISPREEIPDASLLPGGDLRGIVKISVTLNTNNIIYGTGVLISRDVVAVVGHLLENETGHAVHVTVYAGYGSGEKFVEERRATCAVMHYAWFDDWAAANDLAFLRLESEFNEAIQTITYSQTPATEGDITGRIIAFSGDMTKCAVSTSSLQYNPSNVSGPGLLEHKADTTGGASGGAVLDDRGFLIAIHKGYMRGNQAKPVTNTAVTVNRHGNDFREFIGALLYHANRSDEAANGSLSLTENQPELGWTPKLWERIEGARWKKNNGCVYYW